MTSATLTPAERASLRAIATLNRASAPPRSSRPQAAPARAAPRPPRSSRAASPGQHSSGQHRLGGHEDRRSSGRPPELRRTTGVVLTTAGAILWLAVHTTVAFVAIQRAGLVLLVTGLAWLWLPVPDKRDRLQRRFNQLVSFFEWDPASADDARCSLQDLLEPPGDSGPADPRG